MDCALSHIPPEIWAQICLHTPLGTLVACSQTSRLLFDLTVPYLWRNVEMAHLLALVPGFSMVYRRYPIISMEGGPKFGKRHLLRYSQKLVLSSPTNYLDRLNIYAPYVRKLWLWTDHDTSLISSEDQECPWPTDIVPAMLATNILPNLTTLNIKNEQPPSTSFSVEFDWMKALVLPANNLTGFYITLNLIDAPGAIRQDVWSFLDTVITNSQQITHLDLNIAIPLTQVENSWACLSSFRVPCHVTTLAIRAHMFDHHCLAWLAQMGRLKKLKVYATDQQQPATQIPQFHGVALPEMSFTSLECLEIDVWVGFQEVFSQLWDTPVVTNITELRIWNRCRVDVGILSTIATKSPNLRELQLMILVNEFQIGMLSPLRTLPLRSLTLSGSVLLDKKPLQGVGLHWPTLESLSLQRTRMSPLELPVGLAQLPRLKHLCLAPPSEFPAGVVDLANSHHLPVEVDIYEWKSRSLNLVVNYRWANRVARSEIDILARILVMGSPNTALELEDHQPTTVAFCEILRAQIRYHRQRILEFTT